MCFYKLSASLLLTSKVHTVTQVDDLTSHLPSALPHFVVTRQYSSLCRETLHSQYVRTP